MPTADLPTRLSPEQASALWARQAALQAEASEVLAVEHGARTPADCHAHLEARSSAAERGGPPEAPAP